jgi:septal ring-binding cell division protein DamX/type II secretory pathway predicted ATPase ExeA
MTKNTEQLEPVVGDSAPEQNPFGNDRGLDAYYASPALQQRIDLIRHLLELGRQIILIAGPAQAGKSSMLDMLVQQRPENWLTMKLAAGPTLHAASLLNRLAAHLAVAPVDDDDQGSVIAAIQAKLTELDADGKVVVLAVDDADGLPSDAHRTLVRLAHTEQASAELKILLAANTESSALLQSLRRDQPGQALVHVIVLPEFSRVQTRALIEHQLRCCGVDIAFPFDDAAIDRIHRESGGIPGKIITLARQTFLTRANKATYSKVWPVPSRRVVFTTIAAVVLCVAFWQVSGPEREPSELVELELPGPPEGPAMVVAAPTENAADLGHSAPARAPSQFAERADTAPAALVGPPEQETMPPARDRRDPEALPEAAASDLDSTDPELPVADPPGTAEPAAGTDLDDVPQDPEGDTDAAGSGDTTEPETRLAKASGADAIEPAVAPARIGPTSSGPPKEPDSHDENTMRALTNSVPAYSLAWLRTQTPTDYVLQLFGVHDRNAADDFITRHALEHQTAVYESVFEGKPWYVVLFGHYPDRGAAQTAIDELPSELRKLKPWARPLHSVVNPQ